MNKEILTPPSGDVITVADFKQWALIEHTLDDDLIVKLINGAFAYVEERTCRSLRQQQARYFFDMFEDVQILTSPIASVDQVQYVDIDGITQVLDTAIYESNLPNCVFALSLAQDQRWPELRDGVNKVFIDVTEGYTNPPDDLLNAVYLIGAHWYKNRETSSPVELRDIPFGAEAIIKLHRVIP